MAGVRPANRGWLQEGVIRGNMLGKSILPTDEELGKKDDDHKPGASPRLPQWAPWKTPLRWRRRRILLTLAVLYLVYLLFKNVPYLGGHPDADGHFRGLPSMPISMTSEGETREEDPEPTGPPPGIRAPRDGASPPHTHDGPIKFYRLATTLQRTSHTHGYSYTNRNVLFAVSSLKSATTLLPMICEMSRWSRNWVHAAFMGREDIPLADLLEINGVDQVKCPAIWHDARPDYSEYSTDDRAESSVISALGHIQNYLHPQVTITDDSQDEDEFFVKGLRMKTKALGIPVIEVPKNQVENLMWMTRLDAGSLKSWHTPSVDVLIQVPSGSSGGILRLLKSVRDADYSGMRPPRLIIELPAEIDIIVKEYVAKFVWPPAKRKDPLVPNQLIIRHRIADQRVTQDAASIRFLELFYPSSTANSHVLLLSSQAQLSPLYYQYLMYALLEYKYSSFGEDDVGNIMGASLELPSVLLDGKTRLVPPKPADMDAKRFKDLFPEARHTQFLWEAPNSHATLFFGDKWAELHSFLKYRVKKQHQGDKRSSRAKLVSETLPAWTEYMLEFMRARKYSLVYPATSSSHSFVTIHNELYQSPEEFLPELAPEPEKGAERPPTPLNEPFLRAEHPAARPTNPESPVFTNSQPLHLALPFDGDLPEIPYLPYLLYDGEISSHKHAAIVASNYARTFRETVGGCQIPKDKHRVVLAGSAKDLFCFGDEGEEEWEEDVEDMPPLQDGELFASSTSIVPLETTRTKKLDVTPSAVPTTT